MGTVAKRSACAQSCCHAPHLVAKLIDLAWGELIDRPVGQILDRIMLHFLGHLLRKLLTELLHELLHRGVELCLLLFAQAVAARLLHWGRPDLEKDREDLLEGGKIGMLLDQRGPQRRLEELAVHDPELLDRVHRVFALGEGDTHPGGPECLNELNDPIVHALLPFRGLPDAQPPSSNAYPRLIPNRPCSRPPALWIARRARCTSLSCFNKTVSVLSSVSRSSERAFNISSARAQSSVSETLGDFLRSRLR